jgi:hypothetical protein
MDSLERGFTDQALISAPLSLSNGCGVGVAESVATVLYKMPRRKAIETFEHPRKMEGVGEL